MADMYYVLYTMYITQRYVHVSIFSYDSLVVIQAYICSTLAQGLTKHHYISCLSFYWYIKQCNP
jgi:hypothetical protein